MTRVNLNLQLVNWAERQTAKQLTMTKESLTFNGEFGLQWSFFDLFLWSLQFLIFPHNLILQTHAQTFSDHFQVVSWLPADIDYMLDSLGFTLAGSNIAKGRTPTGWTSLSMWNLVFFFFFFFIHTYSQESLQFAVPGRLAWRPARAVPMGVPTRATCKSLCQFMLQLMISTAGNKHGYPIVT